MRHFAWSMLLLAACGCPVAEAAVPAPVTHSAAPRRVATTLATLRDEVLATERAFAKTMADRDRAAFASFIADEAVFFSGPSQVLRGRAAVVAGWARWFESPVAPFAWAPDEVEVLDSGTLALSSGPVFDADGKPAGRFNSLWRREADGRWRIVFDKGERPCNCGAVMR